MVVKRRSPQQRNPHYHMDGEVGMVTSLTRKTKLPSCLCPHCECATITGIDVCPSCRDGQHST